MYNVAHEFAGDYVYRDLPDANWGPPRTMSIKLY